MSKMQTLDEAASLAHVPTEWNTEGWAEYDDFSSLSGAVRILIDHVRRQSERIAQLEQASSVSHGIPHTDAPVTKDQTK